MTDIEQKALELDLIARVIGTYHATGITGTAVNENILSKPHVREAFDRLIASATKPDPLVEAIEMIRTSGLATDADRAGAFRAALDARGFAIVKKEAVNG